MRLLLDALGQFFPWIGSDGRCTHPCCDDPCANPAHTQGEIDWPPIAAQLAKANSDLVAHRARCRRGLGCHECHVLEGILHDARLVATMVGEEVTT